MSEEQATEIDVLATSTEEVTEVTEVTETEEIATTDETLATSEDSTENEDLEPPASEKATKYINQLTREKYDNERRANDLQRQLDEANAVKAQAPLTEPTLEQFDYDEEKYMDAKVAFRVDKERRNFQTEQTQSQALQQEQIKVATYNSKVDEFKVTHPDFEEKVQAAVNVIGAKETMANTILELDNGPELAYHLASNIELADKLNKMSPTLMIAELGKLSGALENKPKPKTTTAPNPVTNLQTGGKNEPGLPKNMQGGHFS